MQVQIPVSLYTSLLEQQRLQQHQEPVSCSVQAFGQQPGTADVAVAAAPTGRCAQPLRKNASSSAAACYAASASSAAPSVGFCAQQQQQSSMSAAHGFFQGDLPLDLSALSTLSAQGLATASFDAAQIGNAQTGNCAQSKADFVESLLALLYIVRLRNQLSAKAAKEGGDATRSHFATLCGRRMFLSALIVAAKYLQDRNYSNRAWAKISGLPLEEINQNEIEFLRILDYDLYVNHKTYVSWSAMLLARSAQLRRDEPMATTSPAVAPAGLARSKSVDSAAAAASFATASALLNPYLLLQSCGVRQPSVSGDHQPPSPAESGTSLSPQFTPNAPVVPSIQAPPSAPHRIFATPSLSQAFPTMVSSASSVASAAAASLAAAAVATDVHACLGHLWLGASAAPAVDSAAAVCGDLSSNTVTLTPPSTDGSLASTAGLSSSMLSYRPPSLVSASSISSVTSDEFSGLWGYARNGTGLSGAASSADAIRMHLERSGRVARVPSPSAPEDYPSPSSSEGSGQRLAAVVGAKRGRSFEEDMEAFLSFSPPASDDGFGLGASVTKRVKSAM
ncbi:hypothetical protein HDU96_000946 [Phlyctochytrium bullatum]|nr:hypothetical protein HDU96_000946 [Phlyctochytrium bullatum]